MLDAVFSEMRNEMGMISGLENSETCYRVFLHV